MTTPLESLVAVPRELIEAVLSRDGGNACRCIGLSRKAEREYEAGTCPHQRLAAMLSAPQPTPPAGGVEELSESQIQEGWESTFSTNNPFCPCDLRTFTKAARWAERAIRRLASAPRGVETNHLPVHVGVISDIEHVGRQCLDSGRCHHGCTKTCFRREGCVPLSIAGSYLNDDWSIKEAPAAPAVVVDEAMRANAWESAFAHLSEVYKRNKSRSWVLKMLREDYEAALTAALRQEGG